MLGSQRLVISQTPFVPRMYDQKSAKCVYKKKECVCVIETKETSWLSSVASIQPKKLKLSIKSSVRMAS